MAALPPVANVLRIVLTFTVGTDTTTQCGWHVKFTGAGPSQADANAVATSVHLAYVNNWNALAPGTTTKTKATVIDLTNSSTPVGINATTASGGAGALELPANAPCLINYQMNRRYRGGRPRVYLPIGVQSNLASPQAWNASFITSASNALIGWNNALKGLTWTGGNATDLVSVGYYSGGTWVPNEPPVGRTKRVPKLANPPFVDSLIGASVNPKVGSQRRRVRGRIT